MSLVVYKSSIKNRKDEIFIMTRTEIREQIFLLLFRIEFNSEEEMPEQLKLFFEEESQKDEDYTSAKEASEEEKLYISGKFGNICAKISEIDSLINEKAKGWDTARMGKVDLTIIRLGLYELLFDDEIPEGVAINEAVELAKKFGQEESSGFVNGILAKFTQKGSEKPEAEVKKSKFSNKEESAAILVNRKKKSGAKKN